MILCAWGVSAVSPFLIVWWVLREARALLRANGDRPADCDTERLLAWVRHTVSLVKLAVVTVAERLGCLDKLFAVLPTMVSGKEARTTEPLNLSEGQMSALGRFSVVYMALIFMYALLDACSANGSRPRVYPVTSDPEDCPWRQRLQRLLVTAATDWFPAGSGIIVEDYQAFIRAGRGSASPTVLCYHPHGLVAQGLLYLLVLPELNGYKILGAPALQALCPLIRMLFNSGHVGLGSASRSYMKQAMMERENVLLVPGGIQEASLMEFGKEKLFLKQRKGFVRYALQHGYSLTPVYVFGESLSYSQFTNKGTALRFMLNRKWIPTVFACGDWRSPFCLLPKRYPLLLVVGRPLRLPRIEHPSREDVDEYHRMYMHELRRLYTAYAESYYSFCRRAYGLQLPPATHEEEKKGFRVSQQAPVLQMW